MDHSWLHDYLLSKPGAEHDYKLEWRWDRYLLRGKMFAAVTAIPERGKDARYNGHPILNLKCDPRLAEGFREEYPQVILPGFYMDKRTWIAVLLDGELSREVLEDLCELSYRLVLEKLPKYAREAIREEPPRGSDPPGGSPRKEERKG